MLLCCSRALRLSLNPVLSFRHSHLISCTPGCRREGQQVGGITTAVPGSPVHRDLLERVQQRASQGMESLRELGLFTLGKSHLRGILPMCKNSWLGKCWKFPGGIQWKDKWPWAQMRQRKFLCLNQHLKSVGLVWFFFFPCQSSKTLEQIQTSATWDVPNW